MLAYLRCGDALPQHRKGRVPPLQMGSDPGLNHVKQPQPHRLRPHQHSIAAARQKAKLEREARERQEAEDQAATAAQQALARQAQHQQHQQVQLAQQALALLVHP